MSIGRKHMQCIIPNCQGKGDGKNNAYYPRGLCHLHYARKLRTGDTELRPRVRKTPERCKVAGCLQLERYGRMGFCDRHYYRFKKFNDPLAKVNKHAEKATKAEMQLAAIFNAHGHQAICTPRHGDGDLLVDGLIKIEVKSAELQKKEINRLRCPRWAFNIHRHGVLKEVSDYYIFQFLGVPGHKGALYAAFRSPLNCKVKAFSLRSMIRELSPAVKLYEELIKKPSHPQGK